MAQLHYISDTPTVTRVKLGRRTVGSIVQTNSGFRFYPDDGPIGEFFSTLEACKESLADMAQMEWAEGMQLLREARVYSPALVLHAGRWHVFSRSALQSFGRTIEDALTAGGILPRREGLRQPLFVAVEDEVKQADRLIAEAASNTLAKRIANALNEYIPGDRGF